MVPNRGKLCAPTRPPVCEGTVAVRLSFLDLYPWDDLKDILKALTVGLTDMFL